MPFRIKYSSLFAALLFTAVCFAQTNTPAGHWEGNIELPGGQLAVAIDLSQQPDGSWKGSIDIPAQNAKGLPLANITVNQSKVSFEIEKIPGKPAFSGELAQDGKSISGKFAQGDQTFPFKLESKQVAQPEAQSKSQEQILQEIRDLVKKEMPDWHVPGLALAIVKDGKVVLAEGFGLKNLKTKEAVTPNTLFAIGSSTKSFTATLMGIVIDEGRVKWDQPIREVMPQFELHDEFASERMTPKDLLTHRSGLPRHDIMWYNGQFNRAELFERLKYLEETEDFRTVFQYQNLMFMTAGIVEAHLEGKPWEELIRTKIFQPLGMTSSNLSVAEMQKSGDYALPYEYKDPEELKKASGEKPKEGQIKEMPFRNIDAVGPAGSINSSATDMAKWILMNLNEGKPGEKAIVSKAQLDEIHAPAIVVRGGIFSELFTYPEAPYMMYGMGWFIQPYRGHRLLHHGGNIDGFSAMMTFLPDDKIGFVILTNLEGNLMVDSLMFEIADRMLGLQPVDWNNRYKLKWSQIKRVVEQSESKEEVLKKSGTKPSHPLTDFAGTYEDEAYGRLEIAAQGQGLKLTYGTLSSALEHWHYDIFRATQDPLKGTKISFLTNLRGDIDRLSVALEAGVDETVFNYKAPVSMSDPNFLKQFTGEYEFLGLTLTVALRPDHRLSLAVPGQPEYELEPYRGTEFNLKGEPGFSVKFTMQGGKVTEAMFIQPNGVSTAKRK